MQEKSLNKINSQNIHGRKQLFLIYCYLSMLSSQIFKYKKSRLVWCYSFLRNLGYLLEISFMLRVFMNVLLKNLFQSFSVMTENSVLSALEMQNSFYFNSQHLTGFTVIIYSKCAITPKSSLRIMLYIVWTWRQTSTFPQNYLLSHLVMVNTTQVTDMAAQQEVGLISNVHC